MSTPKPGRRVTGVAFVAPPSRVDYASGIDAVLSNDVTDRSVGTHRFDARKRLPDPEQFDVVVLTGSYTRVIGRDPWVNRVRAYVRKRIDTKLPTLGVCFGHQLLAEVLGGRVERMPTAAAGYERITLTDAGREHPAFAKTPASFVSFLWHLDHVARTPEGATVLARAGDTIQAFAMPDSPTMGIQFHPEVTAPMARALAEQADESSPPASGVYDTLSDETVASARLSQEVYGEFVAALTAQ